MESANPANQPPSKKAKESAPASVLSTSASSVSTSSTPASASVSGISVAASSSTPAASSPASYAIAQAVSNFTRSTKVPWEPVSEFNHGDGEYAAVNSLLKKASNNEFYDAINHLIGMAYLASPDTIRSSEFQEKMLNDLLPVFIKIIVRRGFDLNKITKEDLDNLLKASIDEFGRDDPSVGAIYVKFIYTTVEDCMKACRALLEGKKGHCGGTERVFVSLLLEKLEKMEEPTDHITLPYVGETSRQSHPDRMAQKYPNLMHKMVEKMSRQAILYEIKIGKANECNSVHSRNLEALCAALMCLNTKETRAAAARGGGAAAAGGEGGVAVEQEEVGCLGLMKDASAFNKVVCGERRGWSKRSGHDISVWLQQNCNDDNRNTPVIEMVNRSIPVMDFLICEWQDIARYINGSDRSKSRSRAVCENTAANHKRKRIDDITVEDFARYFGWRIGNKSVEEGKGCMNPDNWKIRGDEKMEQHYKTILKEYKDKIEKEPSGLYFPKRNSTLDGYFERIRRGDTNEYIPGYRAAFWLEREEELDHLVIKELWDEALKMKNYFHIHNTEERREYQESLSKTKKSFHVEE